MPLTAVFAVALAGALVGTPLAMAVARRVGLVDRPGPLKPHAVAVPYLGGLGVAAALVVGVTPSPWLALPLAGALALGVADDAADLSPWLRLAGELAIGAGMAAAVPTGLPAGLGPPAVALATVALMNAVNLLDGLDALAGSVGAVAAAGFALVLGDDGRRLALSLAAGLLGFLVFNRPPARVYLGDGGAYLVGAALAALAARAWADHGGGALGAGSLLLVVVPAAEVAAAVVRRARAGRSLLHGDRRHLYDLLAGRGWPAGAVAAAYAASEAALGGGAVLAVHSHRPALAAGLVALGAGAVLAADGAGGALRPEPAAGEAPR